MTDSGGHATEEPRRLFQGSRPDRFKRSLQRGRESITEPLLNRLIVISGVASFKPGYSMKFNHAAL
jgi:hypothetical protein